MLVLLAAFAQDVCLLQTSFLQVRRGSGDVEPVEARLAELEVHVKALDHEVGGIESHLGVESAPTAPERATDTAMAPGEAAVDALLGENATQLASAPPPVERRHRITHAERALRKALAAIDGKDSREGARILCSPGLRAHLSRKGEAPQAQLEHELAAAHVKVACSLAASSPGAASRLAQLALATCLRAQSLDELEKAVQALRDGAPAGAQPRLARAISCVQAEPPADRDRDEATYVLSAIRFAQTARGGVSATEKALEALRASHALADLRGAASLLDASQGTPQAVVLGLAAQQIRLALVSLPGSAGQSVLQQRVGMLGALVEQLKAGVLDASAVQTLSAAAGQLRSVCMDSPAHTDAQAAQIE